MTFSELARSYLEKAGKRRPVLEVLLEQEAHSDVVREAQELVELALKAMLRAAGIDPPKWHDVGPILLEQASTSAPLNAQASRSSPCVTASGRSMKRTKNPEGSWGS